MPSKEDILNLIIIPGTLQFEPYQNGSAIHHRQQIQIFNRTFNKEFEGQFYSNNNQLTILPNKIHIKENDYLNINFDHPNLDRQKDQIVLKYRWIDEDDERNDKYNYKCFDIAQTMERKPKKNSAISFSENTEKCTEMQIATEDLFNNNNVLANFRAQVHLPTNLNMSSANNNKNCSSFELFFKSICYTFQRNPVLGTWLIGESVFLTLVLLVLLVVYLIQRRIKCQYIRPELLDYDYKMPSGEIPIN
ncbi:hypothetical protein SNEBB_000720 [Seison nebaliae]|nr:hypothetical protein SNEBB_000720 [Seison nebaliae]